MESLATNALMQSPVQRLMFYGQRRERNEKQWLLIDKLLKLGIRRNEVANLHNRNVVNVDAGFNVSLSHRNEAPGVYSRIASQKP